MFKDGFGMLNSMQRDIGKPVTAGTPWAVNKAVIAHFTAEFDEGPLIEYREVFNNGRGLQSNRFAARTSMEQYLAIRLQVLSHQYLYLEAYRKSTVQLDTDFRNLQAQYGENSRQAAQVAFNWLTIRDAVIHVVKLAQPGSGRNFPIEMPILPAPWPAPVTAKAPVQLERFIQVEQAIYALLLQVNAFENLPHDASPQLIATRISQLDPIQQQSRWLETAAKTGNRTNGDKKLLLDRITEVTQRIIAKSTPSRKRRGLIPPGSNPSGSTNPQGFSGTSQDLEEETGFDRPPLGGQGAYETSFDRFSGRSSSKAPRMDPAGQSFIEPGAALLRFDKLGRHIKGLAPLSQELKSDEDRDQEIAERNAQLTRSREAMDDILARTRDADSTVFDARRAVEEAIKVREKELKSYSKGWKRPMPPSSSQTATYGSGSGADPTPALPAAPPTLPGAGDQSDIGRQGPQGGFYFDGPIYQGYPPGSGPTSSYGPGPYGGGGSGLKGQPSHGDLKKGERGRRSDRSDQKKTAHKSSDRDSGGRSGRATPSGNESRAGSTHSNESNKSNRSNTNNKSDTKTKVKAKEKTPKDDVDELRRRFKNL